MPASSETKPKLRDVTRLLRQAQVDLLKKAAEDRQKAELLRKLAGKTDA